MSLNKEVERAVIKAVVAQGARGIGLLRDSDPHNRLLIALDGTRQGLIISIEEVLEILERAKSAEDKTGE